MATEQLLYELQELSVEIREIAKGAGEVLRAYLGKENPQVETRRGAGEPITMADREAEMFIQMSLEQLKLDIPIIGEESMTLGRDPRVGQSAFRWLLDPIDGIYQMMDGELDYTVNIALVHSGKPVMGVIFAPGHDELYCGYDDVAYLWPASDAKPERIYVRERPSDGLSVVASESYGDKDEIKAFMEAFTVKEIINRSSSLKLCEIARGRADIYPRLSPTHEWNIAAGDAILRAAGGSIRDLEGDPLRYTGRDPKFLNPNFVASSFDWRANWMA